MPWPVRMVLMVALVALPLTAYLFHRLAAAVSAVTTLPKARTRWILFFILCLFYTLPVLFLFYAVNGWTQDLFVFQSQLSILDYVSHFPFWWGLIVVLESVPLFLLLDLFSPITRLWPKVRPYWLTVQAYLKIGCVCALALYVPIRSYIDTYHIRHNSAEVLLDGLPAELVGLRITLLADIQIDRTTGRRKVNQVSQILDTADTDLLFFAGDLVTSGRVFIPLASEAICSLSERAERFAVMGDHDHWAARDTIPKIMRGCGWNFLENRHYLLNLKGRVVLITGITHVYSNRLGTPDLNELLRLAPDADLKILIAHQPAEPLVHAAANHGYDLVLAGHTHGGQIVLHPLGVPFTPSQIETEYYSGAHRAGTAHVIVTNGIGLTLAPIRYHAPAEVTSIILSRPDDS
ncbi:MAG: metallophosphoesterase [Bacteroidota bacterium]